jgi:hypothetical protein
MAKRSMKAQAARMARIREIYDKLPTVECQKLCSGSCGPIDMSDVERAEFGKRGVTAPDISCLTCPILDWKGHCSQYDIRPMICRLWGVTEGMPCPHGCKVTPAPMPDREAMGLLAEVMETGGAQGRARNWRQLVEATYDMPEGRAFLEALMQRGREGDRGKILGR